MKYIKEHYTALILIAILTILTWYKTLSQVFLGEGFYYFKNNIDFEHISFVSFFFDFVNGAELLFNLFVVIFKDNIFLYQAFQLVAIIILNLSFYILVCSITKKKLIGFMAAVLFSVNYIGNFQMYAIGASFFYERAPYFTFIFLSIALFAKYLDSKKYRDYITSIILYFIGIFLAHYSVFFFPFFLMFIVGIIVAESSRRKKILHYITLILPYLVIKAVLLGGGFFLESSYIISPEPGRLASAGIGTIIIQLLHQLSLATFPEFIISKVAAFYGDFTYLTKISRFYIPTFIIYCAVFVYLLKKERKLRSVIIASFLSFFMIAFLNLFIRFSEVIDMRSPSRYLFVPEMVISIFWSIFFFSIYNRRAYVGKVLVFLFFAYWIYQNIQLTRWSISKAYYEHVAIKKILKYIKDISPKLANDSMIITPRVLGYHGSDFSQIFYGKKETKFIPIVAPKEWLLYRPFDSSKDIILAYDYENNIVVDRTKDYKEILRKKQLGVGDPTK